MRTLALAALLGVTACTSAHTAAARQFEKAGRPDDALAAWNARLAEAPDDREAASGRRRAIEVLVGRLAQSVEDALHAERLREATATLARARTLSDSAGAGATEPAALRAARDEVKHAVEARLDFFLSVGQPLSAARLLTTLKSDLSAAGLESLVAAHGKEVRAAGARRCLALAQVATSAWLARVTERACAALGAPTPRVPVAPECRRTVLIDASAVHGPDSATAPKLGDAVRAAFARSGWWDERATLDAEARIAGTFDSRFEATPMELAVSWTETESYTTTEYQTESYQEPYTTTETYTYTCGTYPSTQTCTGMRTVTNYRTATRSVPKTVTKTRAVGRSKTIPATKEQAWHAAHVDVALALPGTAEALTLRWDDRTEKDGVSHDVTDPHASLTPQRSGVPTPADWSSRQARRLYDALLPRLRALWTEQFCREGLQTPEAAARCLLGGGDAARFPEARLALARFLGEPPALVDELLAPGEPQAPPRPPDVATPD